MGYRSRVYRQRNPHKDESKQEKTASKSKENKAKSPVQKKLAINKPGDKYEKEADAAAGKVSEPQAEGQVVQQKEISNIQRDASTGEEEKVSTAEGRMANDKKIQEKLQKMDEPKKEEEKGVQKKDEPIKQEEVSKPKK